ncbi:hypothetical protein OF83DRAFT_1169060 [Amylostereum chailletii]|nr:hypothetical protein OF83DRAFT_1169060 [Amylostereum chailletii]
MFSQHFDIDDAPFETLEERFQTLSVAGVRAGSSSQPQSTSVQHHKPLPPSALFGHFGRSRSPISRCPSPSPTELSFSRQDRKKSRESNQVYSKLSRDQRRQAKVRFTEETIPYPKRKVWPPRKEGAGTSSRKGATIVIPSLVQRVVNSLANFSLSDKSSEEEDEVSSIYVFQANPPFASSSLGGSGSDSLPDTPSSVHPMFRLPNPGSSPSSSVSSLLTSPEWATSSLPFPSSNPISTPKPRHCSRPSFLDSYIENEKPLPPRHGKRKINFKVQVQPDHLHDGSAMRRIGRFKAARSFGQPYLRPHRRPNLSVHAYSSEKHTPTIDSSILTPAQTLQNALVSVRPPTPPIRNGMPVISFERMSRWGDDEEL